MEYSQEFKAQVRATYAQILDAIRSGTGGGDAMRMAAEATARHLNKDGDLGITARDVLGIIEVAQAWRKAPGP